MGRRYMGRGSEGGQPHLGEIVKQGLHVEYMRQTNELNAEVVKAFSQADGDRIRMLKGRRPIFTKDDYGEERDVAGHDRLRYAKALLKARAESIQKADPGMNTAIGYNFYDLRGPAYLLYPVNTPFRNSLPRIGRVNDGYGVAAHWKASKNFGTAYAGVFEGQRAPIATTDENDYVATYKEIGVERGATFTSQFAGEGYTDNVADEHLRGLHEIWLQEEGLMLAGNSGNGTGNNGFKLGTTKTPVATGGILGTLADNYYTLYCVAITALGQPNNLQYGYNAPFTVAGGLVPVSTRTNADGSQQVVNGGTAAISLASNTVQLNGGGNGSLVGTFSAANLALMRGAFWFAWFVDVEASNTTVKASAVLAAITSLPTVTFLNNAGWGTQIATAAGLGTDYSFQPSDFDGLLTYASTSGLWTNMAGAKLTAVGNGRIAEIETDLQSLWTLYQAQVDEIWCSVDAKVSISNVVLSTTSGAFPAFRFEYTRDSQGNVMGGYVVDSYKSQFSMNASGGNALPLKIHPMMPPGTIYYHIKTNPYPHSRVPFVAGMLVQRDYYSIEWPLVSRQWTFGTYCHEVLAHTMPWITVVRTGIGQS